MPDIQCAQIPVPDDAQFQEVPEMMMEILDVRPDGGEAKMGLFVLNVVPRAKYGPEAYGTEALQALLVCMNHEVQKVLFNAIKLVEARDLARVTPPENPKSLPAMPKVRGQMSLRQMFSWMDRTHSTVVTFTMAGEAADLSDACLYCFLRTPETIRDVLNESSRLTKAFDDTN